MAIKRLTSWLSRVTRPAPKIRSNQVRLKAEALEDRSVPATFVVNTDGANTEAGFSTGPSPEGSFTLADAIISSNKTPGLNKITFAIPPIVNPASGTPEYARRVIIIPAAGLPIITNPVIIDGTPIAGEANITNGKNNFGIAEDTAAGKYAKGSPGLVFDVGTVNNQTAGTVNFDVGTGGRIPVTFSTMNNVTLFFPTFGLPNASGTSGSGVIIAPGARAILTGGHIENAGTNTDTTANSTTKLTFTNGLSGGALVSLTFYSPGDGVDVYSGATGLGSSVGATGTDPRTTTGNQGIVIDSNGRNGVFIGPETGQSNVPAFNQIQQCTIHDNQEAGVLIQDASDTLVGDPVNPNGRNSIFSNVTNGVEIRSTTNAFLAIRNRIQGNIIGSVADTTGANFQDGIYLFNAPNTLVGGTQTNAGNTIDANKEHGIEATGTGGTTGLVVQQNTIGGQPSPNNLDGIFLHDAPGALIGGTNTARNVIDWNDRAGIEIQAGSNNTQIINNDISNNVNQGVFITNSVSITIGGPSQFSGNTFTSDGRAGIEIDNQNNPTSPNSPTVIQGNTFTGDAADGNQTGVISGSILLNDVQNLQIGGTPPQAGNTINGSSNGIMVRAGSKNITIQGNKIGTGAANSLDGIVVDGLIDPSFAGSGVADTVAIGTIGSGGGNTVSNSRNGIVVKNGATNVTIQANTVTGNTQNGILITDDPIDTFGNPVTAITSVLIGGEANTLTRNIITGNQRSGIYLQGQYVQNNVIQNNLIGVNANGTAAGNTENGVEIDGASLNTIGGENALSRNIISFNTGNGVRIENLNPFNPSPFGNVISGNSIGTDVTGTVNEGNGATGVIIDGSGSNTVGGYDPNATPIQNPGNLIAFNHGNGVTVFDTLATGNAQNDAVIGNEIYSNTQLAINLGNDLGLVTMNHNPPYVGSGPNQFQNFPVLATAVSGLVGSQITGTITSAPGTYRLEFFGDPAANTGGSPAGYGQGQVYLGFENVTVPGVGSVTFAFNSTISVKGGTFVSATATNISGGLPGPTSEMALSVPVTIATGQISGRKFNDLDGSGTDVAGDPGLGGWVIDLFAGNDVTVDASTTTAADGSYSFNNLTDGTYTIKEVNQVGWVNTFQPTPDPMQITGGVQLTNVDFGNFKALSIQGHKFNDLNNDGKNDPGDPGLAGIQFELWQVLANKTKLALAISQSDLNGNFQFTNVAPTLQPIGNVSNLNAIVAPGPITLQVTEIIPVGWTLTTGNPPAFTIKSGTNVTGLLWGDHKGGGGGGGGGGTGVGPITVVGSGAGMNATVLVYTASTKPKLLYTIHPYGSKFSGGATVAVADVTGDGQPDIIVAPGPGLASVLPGNGSLVQVYDGNTGKLVKQFNAYGGTWNGGLFVAAGDINHDGFADIVTGPMAGGGPNVKAFDGQTGIQLFNYNAYVSTFTGGVRVAVGDVNGDGFADIITSPGAGMAPIVEEWDGSNYGTGNPPALIRSFNAFGPTNLGGVFVSVAHNVGSSFVNIVAGTGSGIPMVSTFDGTTGTQLSNFQVGPAANNPSQIFGSTSWTSGVHVGAVDLDGDGLDDVLTGPDKLRAAGVRGYNARSGKLLLSFNPISSSFLGGVWVAGGE